MARTPPLRVQAILMRTTFRSVVLGFPSLPQLFFPSLLVFLLLLFLSLPPSPPPLPPETTIKTSTVRLGYEITAI